MNMTDLTFSEIEKINEARERRLIEASLKVSTQRFRGTYEAKRKIMMKNINSEACQIMRIKIDVLSHHHYLMKDWRWHGFEMMYFGWTREEKLQELKRLNIEYDKLL
ncbi:hypothetical protein GU337_00130 [Lactococcus raffinolactis]|nr:hypothetical protein GU337_00130 [Lactococcus raffinolactis]